MYNPLAALQQRKWVWPCVTCAGCQSPAAPAASDVAFGIDWETPAEGPDDHQDAVAPSATIARNIDCSDLPNNAAAVIRMTILWFQLSGTGLVNLLYEMVVLALRDDNGDLHCDINAWAGPSVNNGAAGFQVDTITTPDNDTVRVQLINLNAEDATVLWRWVISPVEAGAPVPPP